MKSIFEIVERVDLNIQHEDFESTWIEIKNTMSKNIICGCIYRHPRSDLSEFNAYINNFLLTLDKESKGGKEVYISGDFNIDLLKLPNNSSYQDFYNSMVGHDFLPQITYPTRAVNSSSAIIDNIYSITTIAETYY